MKIFFWGVRGSIPTPLSSFQIQKKLHAVVQRITTQDISSPDSRERFIASLPNWIYGTVGGNTPCVELTTKNGETIILDAGSGIRMLGKKLAQIDKPIHIFLSHFHWDHIQGLPFFDPIFNPKREIHFYTFSESCSDFFKKQMQPPFFPVTMDSTSKNIFYHHVQPGVQFNIGDVEICAKKMSHPGGCYAYSFKENGKTFIYSTDVEIKLEDFENNTENDNFFNEADLLVFDSQYTLGEAVEKQNWGHTSFCYAVDFASAWNVKKLYLYHHEPNYDDKKLYSILKSAQWYNEYTVSNRNLQVFLAEEGEEVEI